jgi:hypothetical protein
VQAQDTRPAWCQHNLKHLSAFLAAPRLKTARKYGNAMAGKLHGLLT